MGRGLALAVHAYACCAFALQRSALQIRRRRSERASSSLFDDDDDAVRVRFETTIGDFHVNLDRALSPIGVGHFLGLISDRFFDEMVLWRVVPGALVQWGIAADPAAMQRWDPRLGAPIAPLPDEPNLAPFRAGTFSYAGAGENSRCCHFFVALDPTAARLGEAPHETTLGYVEEPDFFDRVVDLYRGAGYDETLDAGAFAADLSQVGNEAAAPYPDLVRIASCTVC